jgi:hypothetical protein
MRPNRRHEERQRALERKAAVQAREIISKAERAASRKGQRRKAIVGEIVLSVAIALVLFGLWLLFQVLTQS